MAATLFASPPSASLPEAITHFLQAEKLKPDGWKENRLFIAKCFIGENEDDGLCYLILLFIGEGDYTQAVIWLDKADSIPLASADVREGIKVSRFVVVTVRLTYCEALLTKYSLFSSSQMIMVRGFLNVYCPVFD